MRDTLDQTRFKRALPEFAWPRIHINFEKDGRCGSHHHGPGDAFEWQIVETRNMSDAQAKNPKGRSGREKIDTAFVVDVPDQPVCQHRVYGAPNLWVVLAPDLVE